MAVTDLQRRIGVDPRDKGATLDGVADDRAALLLADAATEPMILPAGKTAAVASNVTLSGEIIPAGGLIKPASGVTVTVNGRVQETGLAWIDTSAGGTVKRDDGIGPVHNVLDYEGATLNAKWDALIAGITAEKPFTVRIPHPGKNQTWSVERRSGQDDWVWKLTAPLDLDGKCNYATIYAEAPIMATAAMDAMIEMGNTSKPENITFVGDLFLDADGRPPAVCTSSRVARFAVTGRLHLMSADVPLDIDDSIGPSSQIDFPSFTFSTSRRPGYGSRAGSRTRCGAVDIGLIYFQNAGTTGSIPMLVKGKVRDLDVDHVIFNDDSTPADPTDLVVVQNDANGALSRARFGHLRNEQGTNSFRTEDTTSTTGGEGHGHAHRARPQGRQSDNWDTGTRITDARGAVYSERPAVSTWTSRAPRRTPPSPGAGAGRRSTASTPTISAAHPRAPPSTTRGTRSTTRAMAPCG